jgi:hypothetical protein
MTQQLKKGCKMRIRGNLTREERTVLKELKDDQTIIICPAD